MDTVLITNSTGFIGNHLLQALLEHPEIKKLICVNGRGNPYWQHENYFGKKIYTLTGDLNKLDLDQLTRLEPDTVFHNAGTAKISSDSETLFDNNVKLTFNLLNAMPIGCRFIFTSSSTVYGDGHKHIPFTEQDVPKPTSVYGASKLACEAFVNAYTKLGRIKGVNLRLCGNVGGGATHGLLKDLVGKVKDKQNHRLQLFGNKPGSIKPFVHVSDTVRAMLWFAEVDRYVGGAWNVSAEDTLSVEEVADLVMGTYGIYKEKEWLGEESLWAGDNKEFSMTNRRITQAGFKFDYPSSVEAVITAIKELE